MPRTVKPMMKLDDESLHQIRLEMSPERKARLSSAAAKACALVERETAGPAEAITALQFAVDAMSKHYFGGQFKGTVIVGERTVPDAKCYECGAAINRASGMDDPGSMPDPGCVVVCSQCGAIAVFDDELRPVKPPEKDLDEIRNNDAVMGIVAAVKAAVERRKKGREGNV